MDHVTALAVVPRGGSVHRERLGGSEGAAVWGLGAQRLQLLTREKAASNQPLSEARWKDKHIGAAALNPLQGVQDRDIFAKRGQREHIVLAIPGHTFTSNIPADDAEMTSLSVGSVFAHTSWPFAWVFLQSLASQFCRFTTQLGPVSLSEIEPWDILHVKKYKPPGIFRPSVKQKCLFDESIMYSLPNTDNSSLDFLLLGFKKSRKKERIYYVLHKALCLSGLAIN